MVQIERRNLMTGDSDWVVVLSTFNQADIALAKHILDREDIVHVVQARGWSQMVDSNSMGTGR